MTAFIARKTVILILECVFRDGMYFQDAFSRELGAAGPEAEKHRAYIFRLSKGTVERRITIEALLSGVSSVPLKKIRPAVLCILEAAVYELTWMDTAEHAVVNESVTLTGQLGFRDLKGFVNGVLRSWQRDRDKLFSKLRISERLSLPGSLYLLLRRSYGAEITEKIAASFFKEEKITARRIVSSCTEEELARELEEDSAEWEKTGLTEHSLYLRLKGGLRPEKLKSLRNGHLYIQDISSMLDAEVGEKLLTGDGPFTVLDCCAAPGGKSIDLLDSLGGRSGRFVCCDVSEKKVSLLKENLERLGLRKCEAVVQDASECCASFLNGFDLVIADVPCSGIGIIGKKPDIRFHLDDASLRELEALQKKILSNVASYVKPGGFLIYSTCTLNPGENRGQIAGFLAEHPEYEVMDLRPFVPPVYRKQIPDCGLCEGPDLTVIPGVHPSDGFYLCLLHRKEASD